MTTDGEIVDIDWPPDANYLPAMAPETEYLFWTGDTAYISSMDPAIPTMRISMNRFEGQCGRQMVSRYFLLRRVVYISRGSLISRLRLFPEILRCKALLVLWNGYLNKQKKELL